MSEIEKLYEECGIKKDWTAIGFDDIEDCYPLFTAEKQLELIDWFIKNEDDIQIEFDCDDNLYYFETVQDKRKTIGKSLAEALANLINIYFENFTDGEIEEVKEILE